MIQVTNVSLQLQKDLILDQINVQFESNKIHGLVGRNGSGKTMLMKCICGYIHPTKGTISFDGKKLGKDIDFPKSIGLIIETPGFIPYYSGYRNLKLLTEVKGLISKEEILETLNKVGLDGKMRKHVRKYSLGMRQRLGIAQAIMENPNYLILDEPFNGLDKEGVAEIRQVLLEFKDEGKTIILASHNSEDIRILCDDVYEMDKGRLTKI